MNNMEKICLKWNDFEKNIRESYLQLREDQNYFDVTLATDDGHTIEAHKIILSAGSQFFNNILKQNKHPREGLKKKTAKFGKKSESPLTPPPHNLGQLSR